MSAQAEKLTKAQAWLLVDMTYNDTVVGQKYGPGIALERLGYAEREATGNRQVRMRITPAGRAAISPTSTEGKE